MSEHLSITDRERPIKEILSVVQRNYPNKKERQRRLIVRRKQDLMICILEGSSFYEFEDGAMQMQAGDVIFVARDCYYQRRILTENYRTVYVYFYFDEETENLPPHEVFRGSDGMEMSFMRLYKKWAAHGMAYKSESMSLFYQLYAQLIQANRPNYLPQAKQELFDQVMHRISEHYTDAELSVAELAEDAGISEVHFRRCFRKIYKVSPQEYITALRVEHAKERIQYSGGAMDEIAKSVGFRDPGYFSRIFKKKTGFTPSEYRRQIEQRTDLKYSQINNDLVETKK